MADELTLDTVPRTLKELLALTRKVRCQVFDLLCVASVDPLEPGKVAFKKLTNEEQAQHLFELLDSFDEGSKIPEGFVVIPITLPLRARRHSDNEKRLAVFAAQLEDTLSTLTEDGFQGIQPIKFEGHGLLVVAHRQPSASEVGAALIRMAMTDPSMGGMPGMGMSHNPMEAVASTLVSAVSHTLATTGKVCEQDVENMVKKHLKGIPLEGLNLVVAGLQQHIDQHDADVKSDPAHKCTFSDDLRRLQRVIKDKARLQLS